jgi:hypothetical protein
MEFEEAQDPEVVARKVAQAKKARAEARKRVKARIMKDKHSKKYSSGATGRYLHPGGGKISTANPKSELEWVITRAKLTPGPNAYMPKYPDSGGSGATKISDADPKSEIDWIIYRAKQTPGPNAYMPKLIPGASFTPKMAEGNPKSELDWVIYRSKQTPGPSEYDVSLSPYPIISKKKR